VELRESSFIRGVKHVTLDAHGDGRGRFMETFRREWFPEREWGAVQVNLATSQAGVLRGLHYHLHQVDYWFPVSGRIRAGLFDLRRGSPTEGARELFELDARTPAGVFIPVGVAHGYVTLSDSILSYVVDAYFDGSDELGVAWDDPEIAMPWDARGPVLSARDRANPRLSALRGAKLPEF
jgi:dTDP-4-dehydrorhamnose 3,5-epimerase